MEIESLKSDVVFIRMFLALFLADDDVDISNDVLT